MKLGIMQPYFMPYIGYWQLIKAVDKYVIYDDVNFIKRGWANRNNILFDSKAHLFSISLKEASQNKLFNEIYIADDFVKFKQTLYYAYKKSPYYTKTIELLNCIFSYEDRLLSSFIKNSFDIILDYLNISTELILSSDIKKNNTLKGQDKILEICKKMNATHYINAIGGKELYERNEFRKNNIELEFIETEKIEYKQFNNIFIPNLSIIDVMMFNSVEEINAMLDNYKLI